RQEAGNSYCEMGPVENVDSIVRRKGAETKPSNGIQVTRLPIGVHGHAALIAGTPEYQWIAPGPIAVEVPEVGEIRHQHVVIENRAAVEQNGQYGKEADYGRQNVDHGLILRNRRAPAPISPKGECYAEQNHGMAGRR